MGFVEKNLILPLIIPTVFIFVKFFTRSPLTYLKTHNFSILKRLIFMHSIFMQEKSRWKKKMLLNLPIPKLRLLKNKYSQWIRQRKLPILLLRLPMQSPLAPT